RLWRELHAASHAEARVRGVAREALRTHEVSRAAAPRDLRAAVLAAPRAFPRHRAARRATLHGKVHALTRRGGDLRAAAARDLLRVDVRDVVLGMALRARHEAQGYPPVHR